MVTSLHELTKQLDALTYNSRSVLNALIRSVLSAGSSDGYQVIRAGKPITLSRTDIYHLYTLYQIWESRLNAVTDSEGVTSYGLAELVAELDADYQSKNGDNTKTPYTEAVVKHSQILYKNSDNAGNEDAAYWISLVDQSSNPKMVTNSAPIPVNIRTPIYDENLSTKRFSEYETYLFPRGYYTLDAMGSYGDGIVHNAGGHKWMFDVDSVFQVKAPLSVFGVQDSNWVGRLPNNYGLDKSYSMVVGTNNFAYAPNVFLSGKYNQSIAGESAVVGGTANNVYAKNGVVIGGNSCEVIADESTAGGYNSVANAVDSFVYGYRNGVGGYPYPCRIGVSITDGSVIEPTTTCKETIEVDGCTYAKTTGPVASSSENNAVALGSSEVYIEYLDVEYSGISTNHISSGDAGATSDLDFKVGDVVKVFAMASESSVSDFPISTAITATVTGIRKQTVGDNGNTVTGYIVTLNKTIRPSHNLSVNRGYIMRDLSVDYWLTGKDGAPTEQVNRSTKYSSSLGIRTIAAGLGQMVVGAQNRELLRPNFIVGIGNTDYIAAAERYNGLVVGPFSNYMTVRDQYHVSGISTFTTAKMEHHGMVDDDVANEAKQYDEDDVDKYTGFYAYSSSSQEVTTGRAVLRVYNRYSCLLVKDAGVEVYRPFYATTETITNGEIAGLRGGLVSTVVTGGNTGSVLVTNTSGQVADASIVALSNLLPDAIDQKQKSVLVYGESGLAMNSSTVSILQSAGRVQLTGGALDISFGTTYNALVAETLAVGTKTGINHYDRIIRKVQSYHGESLGTGWKSYTEVGTGFYYTNGTDALPSYVGDLALHADSYHVINTSRLMSQRAGTSRYSVAQFLLPGVVSSGWSEHGHGDMLPHPVFVTSVVDTTNPDHYAENISTMSQSQRYVCEELAYLSDLENYVRRDSTDCTMCSLVGVLAYDWLERGPEDYCRYDHGTVDVAGNNRFFIYDTYLDSMIDADTSDMDRKWFQPEAQDLTDSNHGWRGYLCRVSRATPWLAANLIDLNNLGGSYYLDGVAINPSMHMHVIDVANHTICGINYLAFGDREMVNPESYYAQWWNQPVSSRGTQCTLATSKYSNGAPNGAERTPMQSVWTTVLVDYGDTSHTQILKWRKLLDNFHLYYANNKLCVEFTLDGSTLINYTESSETHDAYAMPVEADPNYGAMKVKLTDDPDEWPRMCMIDDDETALRLCLPVDPSLGEHLRNVYNASTGVRANMYGRVEYTGNENVTVTGTFYYDVPEYTANNQIHPSIGYRGAYLVMEIAGWDSERTTTHQVHLEGMVNYV